MSQSQRSKQKQQNRQRRNYARRLIAHGTAAALQRVPRSYWRKRKAKPAAELVPPREDVRHLRIAPPRKTAQPIAAAMLLVALLTSFAGAQLWPQPQSDPCPGGVCPIQASGPRPQVSVPRAVAAATCQVTNWFGTGVGMTGSGVLVARGNGVGIVLTAGHILQHGAGRFVVRFAHGDFQANLVDFDRRQDVAVLELVDPGVEPIGVAAAAPQQGQLVRTLGYGPGQLTYYEGRVDGYVTREGGYPNATLEVTSPVTQGDSGAPMLDERWECCGLIFGTGRRVANGASWTPFRNLVDRVRARCQSRQQRARPHTAPIQTHATSPQPRVPAGPPAGPVVQDPDQLERHNAERADWQAQREAWQRDRDAWLAEQERARQDAEAERRQERANLDAQRRVAEKLQAELARKRTETAQKADLITRLGDQLERKARAAGGAAIGGWLGAFLPAGIAGLAGMGIAYVGSKLVRRFARKGRERIEQRVEQQFDATPAQRVVVREPAPPAPMTIEEQHHTKFVEVPDNVEGRAWAEAIRIYGNRYPGAVSTLEALESIKDQLMKGEPRKPAANG